jgi:hypothetical protein
LLPDFLPQKTQDKKSATEDPSTSSGQAQRKIKNQGGKTSWRAKLWKGGEQNLL